MSVSLEQRSDANYALKLDQVTASVGNVSFEILFELV